jgi:hypothetical protein
MKLRLCALLVAALVAVLGAATPAVTALLGVGVAHPPAAETRRCNHDPIECRCLDGMQASLSIQRPGAGAPVLGIGTRPVPQRSPGRICDLDVMA